MPVNQVQYLRTATIDMTSTKADRVDTIARFVQLGPVGIGAYQNPTELVVECDDVGSAYFAQIPLAGRLVSRHRGAELTITRGTAAIYQPDGGEFLGRWTAGTRTLCIGLDQVSVDSALAKLLGEPPNPFGGFELTVDTQRPALRDWVELVYSLGRQLSGSSALLAQPMVADPLAESVVNGFLLATRHAYSEVLESEACAPRPVVVRRAVALLEEQPRLSWTVSRLAADCQVSVRTLQSGFRAHLGRSPMAYLRDVRLRGAHDELRTADPLADSVAAIAQRWGFGHLGRFAAAHEAKYGQTPLRTLRALR